MDFIRYDIADQIAAYQLAWEKLDLGSVRGFARPTTLSIKVASKSELFDLLERNAGNIEQVHIGTVANRYIASAALQQPYQDLAILKVLERRPGSQDPLGLDSIDYLVKDIDAAFRLLRPLGIERESNDMHAWLSLRFGETQQFEAKFTDHLVLHVGIKELEMAETRLVHKLKS